MKVYGSGGLILSKSSAKQRGSSLKIQKSASKLSRRKSATKSNGPLGDLSEIELGDIDESQRRASNWETLDDVTEQSGGAVQNRLGVPLDDGADQTSPNRTKSPVPFHQDILRAMNIHSTLVAALSIDYNLAFRGSVCSPSEKLESRIMLVDTLRRCMGLLVQFVRANKKNQRLVFKAALPRSSADGSPYCLPSLPTIRNSPKSTTRPRNPPLPQQR